jgi:hypothetical protein
MKYAILICGLLTSLGLVMLVAEGPNRAHAQNVPPPLRPDGPSLGSNVNVALVKEAHVSSNGGEIVEFNGTLVQFSDAWILIQNPDTGNRVWIPTRQVACVTQESGQRPPPRRVPQ